MPKLSVEQALAKARSHAKKGNYQEAQRLYEAVLEKFPKNNRVKQALAELNLPRQPVSKQQPPPDTVNWLTELYNQGQLPEVVEQTKALIKRYPKSFFLWNVLGLALKGLKLSGEASEAFKQVTELNSSSADGFSNYGISLHDEGKLQEAVSAYKKALAINPHHAGAHYNMGNALKDQGEHEEAISAYKTAVSLKPDYAKAYNNMGVTLHNQGKLKDAIEVYRTLLSLTPNNAEAYCNLGNALKDQSKPNEAIAAFEKALSLQPSHHRAYYNLGNLFRDQGRLEEAVEAYEKAVFAKPDYTRAYNNMGATLKGQGRLSEAVKIYEKVISISPDNAEANFNLGMLLWLKNDFAQAFELIEWRWKIKHQQMGVYLESSRPSWNGENGKKILVWKEQGIGDQVMFGSMLPELNKRSKSLIVECDERLMPLYERSFDEQIEFVSDRREVSAHDYQNHIAIGSLARFFRHEINDFHLTSDGWLKPDLVRTAQLRKNLRKNDERKVIGISWFTNSKLEGAKHRSVPTDVLAEHLRHFPGNYVSLQYGKTSEEIDEMRSRFGIEIKQVAEVDLFNDLDGLSALISACDIVISIDNATVHFAGALGVDTRVLLPLRADDRWGLNSSESYWYESLKLYRQQQLDNWHDPLQKLVSDLDVMPTQSTSTG